MQIKKGKIWFNKKRSAKSKKLSETTVLLYVIVIATCEGAKSHTTLGFQSRGEKI